MPRFVYDPEARQMVEVPYWRDLPRPPSVFPTVQRDMAAYKSPLGNGWIDGRAARREELKRADCREVDPSEFRAVAWNPDNARRYGLPHEPPPSMPDHVKRWQEGTLAHRSAVDAAPATPEMRQAAAAEALRLAQK
jgi:hypothetical protein